MKRRFDKMHGLGNDFVIVDAREEPFDGHAGLARAIADRRTGVGCDQLIVLEPSDNADLKMRIWNSDGGEVESCGNATRCVVQLTGARRIDSDGGLLEGESLGAEVEVALREPRFGWDEIPLAYAMDTAALPMAWDELEHPMALNVGNPHLVFFVPDAREVPLDELGPTIEHDPAFPERINVNVATRRERPPEAAHLRARRRRNARLRHGRLRDRRRGDRDQARAIACPGGHDRRQLTISWAPGEPIRMRGAATHVFSGELDLEALQ